MDRKRVARSIKSTARDMAISEVKNFTGGAVRDSHVKLFIAFEPYFLSEILNLGGLGRGVMQETMRSSDNQPGYLGYLPNQ